MKIPEYITVEEVKRVCKELGFRDWTTLKDASVTTEEAQKVLDVVNVAGMPIAVEDFRMGLDVELEHGFMYLKEALDYYQRLDVAEIEGDMEKAAADGNADKLLAKYKKLVIAKKALADAEAMLVK